MISSVMLDQVNDENEVSARVTENENREDRSENMSKNDPSLDLPII